MNSNSEKSNKVIKICYYTLIVNFYLIIFLNRQLQFFLV